MKTRELYRDGHWSIGVFDELNYYTAKWLVKGDESKTPGVEYLTDIHYFSNMENAVKWMVDRVAKASAVDLKDWLSTIRSEREKIEGALKI